MAIIIFDLDDTLLDTERFKADYFTALAGILGVSLRTIFYLYEKFKVTQNGNFDHAPYVAFMANKLQKEVPAPAAALLERFSWRDYADQSVFDILRILQKEHDLHLVSKGAPKLQKIKLRDSGLGEFFFTENTVFHEEFKTDAIRKNFTDMPIYFVNDKLNETREVAEHFPSFIPIVFTGYSKKNIADLPDRYHVIDELSQLFDIIKK